MLAQVGQSCDDCADSRPMLKDLPLSSSVASGPHECSTFLDGRSISSTTSVKPKIHPSPEQKVPSTTTSNRLSQTARGNSALWRAESPHEVLIAFLAAAARLLEGGAVATPTLYVIEPWLQGVMSESGRAETWSAPPTVFFLSGKVTVHGYQRNGGGRVEPPRFKNLATLPMSGSGSFLALPLQRRTGEPILAALQVVLSQEHSRSPKKSMESFEGLAQDSTDGTDAPWYLTDSQIAALQLLCATTAGILDMRLRIEGVKAIHPSSTSLVSGCPSTTMKRRTSYLRLWGRTMRRSLARRRVPRPSLADAMCRDSQ